jgi:hypothetical protein
MPGVRINLGLHGAGLSVGLRGLHVGVNRRGMYTSAGIPGTGIYAIHHIRSSAVQHPTQCCRKRQELRAWLCARRDYRFYGGCGGGLLIAVDSDPGVDVLRSGADASRLHILTFLVIATGKFVERDRGLDVSICGEGAGSSGHWSLKIRNRLAFGFFEGIPS